MIKPPRLQPGATLGLCAPASPLFKRSELSRGLAVLEQMGFRVKLAPHARARHGYLAGTDRERAQDLEGLFLDPEVDGIMCLRGGYGSVRLLDYLDFERIAQHPKVFIGFSDITQLHLALARRCNLVTFYGPMVISLARPEPSPYTMEALRRAVCGQEPLGPLAPNPDDPWLECLVPGEAEGELVGGCLALVANSLGTPEEIDTRGRILFLEDVDEEPHCLDACLSQLLRAGKLHQAAGFAIGELAGCGPRRLEPSFPSNLSVEDVLEELLVPLGKPTLYGLPIGHGRHLATLPIGVRARLDAGRKELAILETATSG
ncbi:MAG: LD-carboxypeptidase [Chloroflexi bacterium]|nr:LD-carboxypeptidase [Chloroflexota bacterium]